MAIEWVVGIGVLSLLLGFGIAQLFQISGGKQKSRVAELESALEEANDELVDYKKEVFGQFAQTAEKFRALDHSYQDLHQQLAQSAVSLCGDAATPLLENTGAVQLETEEVKLDSVEEEQIVVSEQEALNADANADEVPFLTEAQDSDPDAEELSELDSQNKPARGIS
ncbi:MAG: DUF1043 family protein [Gammaproteobacteria bacterium]|nr:DUF1043 family protein [Gammaproteobacteria bacterium]